MRRLLTYVVDKSLAGELDQLKEVSVAEAVFERTLEIGDTIVRVGANNVRKCLRQYYEAPEGREEAIRIEIPSPGYIAKFKLAEPVRRVEKVTGNTQPKELREGDSVSGREQWKLGRLLGESPSSVVWLCVHSKTAERRVFKFAFDEARLLRLRREVAVSRFLSNARKTAAVSSAPGEGIAESFSASGRASAAFALLSWRSEFVRVLEWNFDTVPYFVESEYAGENLPAWSDGKGGLAQIEWGDRLKLLVSAAQAVAAAHSLGVIHKDLKPTNILVDDTGKVRVSDFDLAWVTDPGRLEALQITNPGFAKSAGADSSSPAGTMLYVAPEVLRGRSPSMASDVYALGVMLYQLTTCDLRGKLSAGWESEVSDPLIREDIQLAANGSPDQRPTAAALVQRLETLEERRHRAQELEEARIRAQSAEQKLRAARERRPWIAMTVAALTVGCIISLLLLRRASEERDRANREAARESALNRFVSKDILGRVNPFLSGSVHESLEEAVTQASPEIDKEFRNEPQMAGSLHLELARDLEARSSYAEARREYQRAIGLFQRDKGSGAEDAVRAELQEAGMEARWFRPGTLESARKLLASAESEMPKLGSRRAPDLEVWRLAASGSIAIIEAHPGAAVTDFSASIQAAKGIPGFDSASLQTLKGYLAGADMRIPDGASAERLCREMIQEAISRGEGDSAATLRLRTSLAQSLFVQGKYPELIEEADAVYPQLVSRLGVDHSACLRLLSSRAAAAGHLGLWQRCMSDDMAVYQVLVRKQGPISFLALATLSDAGLSQCRAGLYAAGEVNTRKAYEESKQLPKQTGLTDAISYALAYCLVGENKLNEAAGYLKNIDVQAVVHLTGESSVAGDIALAQGEIALRRRNYALAQHYAEIVSGAFAHAQVDEGDRKELVRLQEDIRKHSS